VIYAEIYVFVISLCNGLYLILDWWSMVSHIASAIAVSAIVLCALCLIQIHSPGHVSIGSNGGIVMMMIVLASALGIIWEVIEGLVEIVSGVDHMSYGAYHTLRNLLDNSIGILFMAAVTWVMLRRIGAEGIVSGFRLGKKNIDVMSKTSE
jgi:hypothetical protein